MLSGAFPAGAAGLHFAPGEMAVRIGQVFEDGVETVFEGCAASLGKDPKFRKPGGKHVVEGVQVAAVIIREAQAVPKVHMERFRIFKVLKSDR